MKTICYIPLDDRSVCIKRVQLSALASGFNIVMPELDIISTKLDNQLLNRNHTQYGDMDEIVKWFKSLNHDLIDYYIISVDQVTSGGLVNSRICDYNYNESINYLKEILDEKYIQNKKVIIFDSLMRLASTVGYQGYILKDYNNIRQYAKQERVQLTYPYTIEDIIKTYEYDSNNEFIDNLKYNVSDTQKNKYFTSRIRKLYITEYLIDYANNRNNIYLWIGIDDSFPGITIQSNEINYFRKKEIKNKSIIFTGIDELGLMAVELLAVNEYLHRNVKVKLHYIGNMQHKATDVYDNGTLEETMNYHLDVMKLDVVEKNEDINIVAMTHKLDENDSLTTTVNETIEKVNELLSLNKYVILMDLSLWSKYKALERVLPSKIQLSKLLAYSNWNTVANSIGIALSEGVSRFAYLHDKSCENNIVSHKAFATNLIYAYLKDMGYKAFGVFPIKEDINKICHDDEACQNFFKYLPKFNIQEITLKHLNDSVNNPCSNEVIKNNIIENTIVINDDPRNYMIINDYSIADYIYPWNRTFDLDINIEVELKKISQ